MHLTENQRQTLAWEIIVKKGKCFRYALIGGFWNGKDGRRLARSRVSYVIALDMLLKVGVVVKLS